ncbi:MAG: DUF4124 domain-containing protein, partial [Pseudomonadales bacterium]
MKEIAIGLSLGALLLLVCTDAAAAADRIYKTVDENGNVVFTDIPPREDEKSEQVVIENPNSFDAADAAPDEGKWVVEPEDQSASGGDQTAANFRYGTLSVASPQNDESIRDNAGNVTIIANVAPRLQPGHVMRLFLDGSVVQEGAQTTFNLANVDRGTHT